MSKQSIGCSVLVLVGLCLVAFLLYQIPPINDRLAWRVESLQASIRYALKPPEQAVFQPAGQPLPKLAYDLPTATLTPSPTATSTVPGPTETPACASDGSAGAFEVQLHTLF